VLAMARYVRGRCARGPGGGRAGQSTSRAVQSACCRECDGASVVSLLDHWNDIQRRYLLQPGGEPPGNASAEDTGGAGGGAIPGVGMWPAARGNGPSGGKRPMSKRASTASTPRAARCRRARHGASFVPETVHGWEI